MLMQLGKSYTTSLAVTDVYNNRVSSDTPIIIIRDTQTKKYWNGFTWSDSEFALYLTYIENGIYCYSFTPDKIGKYEIISKSETYNISKTEMLEVYSGELASFSWLISNPFIVRYVDTNSIGSAKVKIVRNIDGLSFYDNQWLPEDIYNDMQYLDNGVYSFSFTPEDIDKYTVDIICGDVEQTYILDVKDTGDNVSPVIVNSSNFVSNNGSDCVVKDDKGNLIAGVQISAFDFISKELISRTSSNQSGQWTMLLKPGKYYFMFEKQGYVSVGLERVVI